MFNRHFRARCLLLLLLICICSSLQTVPAHATTGTSVHLDIRASECVIDVINDGSGQVIHASSTKCALVLPDILTSMPGNLGELTQTIPLPFAGRNIPEQTVKTINQADAPRGPLAKGQQAGDISQPALWLAAIATVALIALAVTAVGIDIALFELRAMKAFLRWANVRWLRGG